MQIRLRRSASLQHPLRHRVLRAIEEVIVVTAGSALFSPCPDFSSHPHRQAVTVKAALKVTSYSSSKTSSRHEDVITLWVLPIWFTIDGFLPIRLKIDSFLPTRLNSDGFLPIQLTIDGFLPTRLKTDGFLPI